jgi:chemotaxis protein MotB
MTKKILLSTAVAGLVLFIGCVPTSKFNAVQQSLASARYDSAQLADKLRNLQATRERENHQSAKTIDSLNQQIDLTREQVATLNKQIAGLSGKNKDLQSEGALRQAALTKSQKDLQDQQAKLEHLQALMDRQKHAIEEIRKKMTNALVGFNAKDLTVSIKNGKVYVSLSENLLFPSGSAEVNPKGKDALSKLGTVLNQNSDITVDIEGHTDSIPIHGKYKDNWELSLARSASIVRILTVDYRVDPTRVIASGHSQFDPVQPNSTTEGRAQNRRTDIILSPKLDELFRLLQTPDTGGL